MKSNLTVASSSSFLRKKSALSFVRNFVHCGKLSCPENCNEHTDRVFCQICEKWFHFRCQKLSKKSFQNIRNKKEIFVCDGVCTSALLPLSQIDHLEFLSFIFGDGKRPCKKCKLDCLGKNLMNCVMCKVCKNWFHETCTTLEYDYAEYLTRQIDHYCSNKCLLTVQPFKTITSDDVEFQTNPNNCKICLEECLGFNLVDCVYCDVCNYWIHAECLNLSPDEFNALVINDDGDENDELFICCDRCWALLLPFNSCSNDDFHSNYNCEDYDMLTVPQPIHEITPPTSIEPARTKTSPQT